MLVALKNQSLTLLLTFGDDIAVYKKGIELNKNKQIIEELYVTFKTDEKYYEVPLKICKCELVNENKTLEWNVENTKYSCLDNAKYILSKKYTTDLLKYPIDLFLDSALPSFAKENDVFNFLYGTQELADSGSFKVNADSSDKYGFYTETVICSGAYNYIFNVVYIKQEISRSNKYSDWTINILENKKFDFSIFLPYLNSFSFHRFEKYNSEEEYYEYLSGYDVALNS